ncbi:MAG: cell division FtsZ family protein [Rikenellaceae bacterium]|nr:cell division FtsZ family protein [Rikenellaceae bacterium]
MSNDILSNLNVEEITHSDIMVVGVGGAGGNALNNMIDSGIYNVTFMACNTDQDALDNSKAELRLQLGNGKGAGSNPEKGRLMALENSNEIFDMIRSSGAHVIFLTAGMGGGTGTGASPVIARVAQEIHNAMMEEDEESLGILTIAVVTTPFSNEGHKRVNQARKGIEELRKYVDAILIINNDSLQDVCGDMPLPQAMKFLDGILTSAVKGMAEIITIYGEHNIDIADANTVMKGNGNVLMGTGRASGVDRAKAVVDQCFNSPLLENRDINGATQILLNMHYSTTNPITMKESSLIRNMLQEKAGGGANLIWGDCVKEELGDDIEIVVVASGFNVEEPHAIENPAAEDSIPATEPTEEVQAESGESAAEQREEEMEIEAQEVLRFRGVNRYDNIDHIYRTPAIKRYGGSFEELRPAKKKVVVQQVAESKPEAEEPSLEGTLFE